MPKSSAKTGLQRVVSQLAEFHGAQESPAAKGAFELILWEKVAYLADDETRSRAFAALKKRVGTSPAAVASAKLSTLREVASIGGAVGVEERSQRMQDAAQLVIGDFDNDLDATISESLAAGRKALRRFYGIGEPGADKILLFTRSHPVFPLDSNGARVLVRLGYGTDHKNYSTMYRSVVDAARPEASTSIDWLIDAHLLLRRHGQAVCKTKPRCEACVIRRDCSFAAKSSKRA
jgi:endonuclease III